MPPGEQSVPVERRTVLRTVGAGVAGSAVATGSGVAGGEPNRRTPDVRVYDLSDAKHSLAVEIRRRPHSENERVFREEVDLEPRGARTFRRAMSSSHRHEATVTLDGQRREIRDVTDVAARRGRASVAVKVGSGGKLSVSQTHVDARRGGD